MGPNHGLKDFSMVTNSTSCTPLDRILEEGIDIKDMEEDPSILLMNGKGGYFQPEFVRVTYSKGLNLGLVRC